MCPWPKEQIECLEIPVGETGETSLIAEGNRHALDYWSFPPDMTSIIVLTTRRPRQSKPERGVGVF